MFSLFLPTKVNEIKLDDKTTYKLAKKILNLPEKSNNLPSNLLDDLEIFEGNKTDKDKTLFEIIDNTNTIFGQIYLEHIVKNPLYKIEDLKFRQSIIKNLIHSNTFNEIDDALKIIKDKQNDLLWFWIDHSVEVEEHYSRNYFSTKYLDLLNNSENALQIYNFYRITISPISIVVYPIFIFLAAYICIKFVYKLNIPFKIFSKMFFKTKFADVLFLGSKSNNVRIIKYIFTTISILTYLYSIYNCIETSLKLNKTISTIFNKMTTIIEVLNNMFKINRDTHSLLKKKSTISNPLPNLLNKIYSSTLNIYSNKGKILCDFRKLRNNKTLLRDIILYTAEIDAYSSIVKLYKKHQYTKCHLCLPDYIVSSIPKIDIKDVWNPILNPNKAVSNSIKLTKNTIITGPNMGGKSTFIKSLMLSILFSQTLTISFCKTQSFTPFSYIQTYLNIPDCKGKESLFEAEMNRAYKYISYLETLEQDSSLFSFIIMDEIFSSTNPREGLSGAYAIADKLGNYKNNISMITTHYSELSLLEKYGKYKNYKIPIDRDISSNIVYPYKIKRGISQQYIALELLRDKGFDKDIINVANDICKKLEPNSTKVQNNKPI